MAIVLIGTKLDVAENVKSRINQKTIDSYVDSLNKRVGYRVPYVEISAANRTNIEIATGLMAGKILTNLKKFDPDECKLCRTTNHEDLILLYQSLFCYECFENDYRKILELMETS